MPLLGSQVTSQMIAISSSHMYCLYPSLMAKQQAFKCYQGTLTRGTIRSMTPVTQHRRAALHKQGVWLLENGSECERLCGIACPWIDRTLFKYRDVSVFHWGGYHNMNLSADVLFPDVYCQLVWRLGEECWNPHCPHCFKRRF